MNAPLDDIRTFMGDIPPDEYEQRSIIRTCRNAASYKVTQTDCADVRALCWMVTERASEWIYEPASVEALTEIVRLCLSLLNVADQFDLIEANYYGQ